MMTGSISVVVAPDMAPSSPISHTESLPDAPTSPDSTLSSDDGSITTIETNISTPIEEPEATDIALDPKVVAVLHDDARIIKATYSNHNGADHPSSTIIIYTRQKIPDPPDPTIKIKEYWTGILKEYFLKTYRGELGHDILRGESESLKAIHKHTRDFRFVSHPWECGRLYCDRSFHFLLTKHHDTNFHNLNIPSFVAALAHLHLRSDHESKMFGFRVTTYQGPIAQINPPTFTWEEYFTTNLEQIFDLEEAIQGPHTREMRTLSFTILDCVIPRLLRPLETDGRSIKPTLLHGDLTPANVATSFKTKRPILLNPCSFYGHNEYDLQALVTGEFGNEALKMYRFYVPVSEPSAEFDDRMKLYRLRALLVESIGSVGVEKSREVVIEAMKGLVEDFGEGYDEKLDGGIDGGEGCSEGEGQDLNWSGLKV